MTSPAESAPPAPVPENRPTPLTVLLSDVTPTEVHYRRNHFAYPKIDEATFRVRVCGAVREPFDISPDELRELPRRRQKVLLECAGHRRTEFSPPISGVQWRLGALSQAHWGGTSLSRLLERAGVAADAGEVVLHGLDAGAFAELPGEHAFVRSIPLAKALHADTLVAYEMNGEPLPIEHGAPVRTIVPGWYAMDSIKWLHRIEVVTQPFRGPFQELDYRFIPQGDTGIGTRLAEMPIHALVANLADGDSAPAGACDLTGIAWAAAGVAGVEVRVDADAWQPAALRPGGSAYELSTWSATVQLPVGRHEIAVRATDRDGDTQPDRPVWNRRGYANHSVQRLTIIGR